MSDETNRVPEGKTPAGDAESARGAPVQGRRRLIKGGLSAAPVILTLTSRPVLGFENACLSPSRMISGNHSGFTGPTTCLGKPRSDWLTDASKADGWAVEMFASVFDAANPYQTKSSTPLTSLTLGAVFLDSYANNDGNAYSAAAAGFASFIIAAYLNAYNNVGSVGTVLTPMQVVHMWNDVIGTGQYWPQISMGWNATGVVGYLQHSGIVPS